MRLTYNGRDIFNDISVNYCVHEMNAEKQSDSLVVRFNDPQGVWSKWNPQAGDEIAFEKESSRTGKMFIHSLKPENGLYTVRAMSMPISGKIIQNRSWEGLRFLRLANSIAEAHGMTFKNYGCTDYLYPYIAQINETDFEFFYRICMQEGCQMMIFDGKLIAYNEQYIESQTPAGSLEVGEDGVFIYEDSSNQSYGAAEVASGSFSGKFKDPNAKSTRILRPDVPLQITGNAEAVRFARGLLRNVNKYEKSGSFSKGLMLGYAAGSILRLTTPKASAWDGTVFINKVRHDYVANKSIIYFRKPLEGY
jgi:hypothetical protein